MEAIHRKLCSGHVFFFSKISKMWACLHTSEEDWVAVGRLRMQKGRKKRQDGAPQAARGGK